MIFLFAAIYCTLVPRDGFIVTLHRTLVYSLGGLDTWRMPQKSGEAQLMISDAAIYWTRVMRNVFVRPFDFSAHAQSGNAIQEERTLPMARY
jgi:hypothetical protein